MNTFEEFFKKATRNNNDEFLPYKYQHRIANLKNIPDILNLPTGVGKTEAVVLSIYLWRRFHSDKEIVKNTPRRLVYCLPMRVLVEQTVTRIKTWLKQLKLENNVDVITMMGGNTDNSYFMQPEKNLIIVGTQDMLLSRALNRGYAESPFRWPIDFGLLNNDCLWVMDEIQLMDNGLTTSVQLDSFRRHFGTFRNCKTIWMSATINKQWLQTVDFDSSHCMEFTLDKSDKKDKKLIKRNNAEKILQKADFEISKDYTIDNVKDIQSNHESGTITLVIVNTVKRAQNIFNLLKQLDVTCMLVHSRFRKNEREKLNAELKDIADTNKDIIVVATQVIEAGIDISAKTLITEIAPWPSLVQRFGRCNRKGEYETSKIYIVELDPKNYSPYQEEDLKHAKDMLKEKYNTSVAPASIQSMDINHTHESVIRKSDLVGLFDTSPDLSGNHTDVSMYVRSLEQSSDVSVIWRDWDKTPPITKITRDEICNVQLDQINKFMKENKAWLYNPRIKKWEMQKEAYPGQLILLKSESGGYSEDVGWDVSSKEKVSDLQESKEEEDSIDDDNNSNNSTWVTLNDHTVHVTNHTKQIVKKLDYLNEFDKTLYDVALYHDLGKAHHIFQETMTKNTVGKKQDEIWAKREGNQRHSRSNYRHEAISALAILSLKPDLPMLHLVAYLVAAHHGKVRLAMRNMYHKDNEASKYILGIGKSEKVPIFLSQKHKSQSKEKLLLDKNIPKEITITTDLAKIGNANNKESWLSMTLNLLNEYGPFKLAMLEAIIRAADTRASKEENNA